MTRTRAARFLDRAIFSSLLVLIPLVAVPYGTVDFWWAAIFNSIVFALAALRIVEGMLCGPRIAGEHRLLLPLLFTAGFAFVQALPLLDAGSEGGTGRSLSADPHAAAMFGFKLLALTLAGALLLRYTSSRNRLRALIHAVIGVGVASALFGLARLAAAAATGNDFAPQRLALGASFGQFVNRNHFAFLMEMSFGLTLGLIVFGKVRRASLILHLAATVLLCVALVLTNSRGGVLSMLSQLLLLALLFCTARVATAAPRERAGRLVRPAEKFRSGVAVQAVLVACLLAALGGGMVLVGGDSLMNRLGTVTNELGSPRDADRTNARRKEIWGATWQLIRDHPIAGAGFGAYGVAIPKYHDASGLWTPDEAHNDYLELLAGGGVIGAALGAWFVIALIGRSRRRLRGADTFRRAAVLGALAGLFGVGVHSFVDFGLHVTVNALVFAALAVIATVNDRAGIAREGLAHS